MHLIYLYLPVYDIPEVNALNRTGLLIFRISVPRNPSRFTIVIPPVAPIKSAVPITNGGASNDGDEDISEGCKYVVFSECGIVRA